ncbi:MAG: alkyl hydroperoxide reductase subunit F [Prevotellaceae bacterium]|jgi:alkyl hydroperoxide reductase subunit F|nr:alkyl hydroperoxide reductase subunit F [Prevotellaceae bacterium]
MLDSDLKEQVEKIFEGLDSDFTLAATLRDGDENAGTMKEMLTEVSALSGKIACRVNKGNETAFSIFRNGVDTGIRFRGTPGGHEFSSFLLAVLNCDGKGKNIPDRATVGRVEALKTPIRLRTYVSLDCTNCPDVVQSLNLMSALNPGIVHETTDGAVFGVEVEALNVQAVPSVYAGDRLIHAGKAGFGELLAVLEAQFGSEVAEDSAIGTETKVYDLIVAGGGPAGVAAAIYSARKGLKTAIVAERVGGQVKDTVAIENLISVPQTTGAALAEALGRHLDAYSVDVLEHRRAEKVEIEGEDKVLTLTGGERCKAPALIVATGASYRRMNVTGEAEYLGRGVAFCPHCDGPFYRDKRVAVVGGGNSGIEAAIDLAGICSKVTVFEFLDELRADKVLQDKARSLPNVEIYASSQTAEVLGNGKKVTGMRVKDRKTGAERSVELDGIFVQIGLVPNSALVKDFVTLNARGEITVDAGCRTGSRGIYAAGDVSSTPFKQIVIAMGEGAKAALSAFEDRMMGN